MLTMVEVVTDAVQVDDRLAQGGAVQYTGGEHVTHHQMVDDLAAGEVEPRAPRDGLIRRREHHTTNTLPTRQEQTDALRHPRHPPRPGPRSHDRCARDPDRADLDLRPGSPRREQGLRNPTRHTLEQVLAALEGGGACAAFASGIAAENALLQAFVGPGDHIVTTPDVYGGTFRLLNSVHGPISFSVMNSWGTQRNSASLPLTFLQVSSNSPIGQGCSGPTAL